MVINYCLLTSALGTVGLLVWLHGLVTLLVNVFPRPFLWRFWFGHLDCWPSSNALLWNVWLYWLLTSSHSFVKVLVWLYWLLTSFHALFCQSIGFVILIADIFLPPLLCRFWFGYSDYWHDVTPSFVKVLVWLYWLLTSSHVLFCVGMGLVILMVGMTSRPLLCRFDLVILIASMTSRPLLCRFWFGYIDCWHDLRPSFLTVVVRLYWLLTSYCALFRHDITVLVDWAHNTEIRTGCLGVQHRDTYSHASFCVQGMSEHLLVRLTK